MAFGHLCPYQGATALMKKSDSVVIAYFYLAIVSGAFGLVLVFVVLLACQYFGVDISQNWWVLAIPVTASVLLNVVLVELFLRRGRK